ncbi:MAG: carboxypeptidase regulatory-like domain-containing protein [Planctomycetes bacterium]|nr:carboxypeptidase regulatory-like domain-containing protein [Planctomycetota bacterium]MBL7008821.1 carboxypeptidase regulatory-like domain-containing protein [Planctomycetota bacterium]
MPAGVWRLAVLLVLLVPDILILSLSAPMDEARPIDEATQQELEARKAERRTRFNRSDAGLEARAPKPVPYDPNPTQVRVKGVLLSAPQPGALAQAEPIRPQEGDVARMVAPEPPSLPEVGPPAVAATLPEAPPDFGRAWLEGQVAQPDGSAVAWLEVRLRAAEDGAAVAATVTDSEGGYRFADLSQGDYRLEFGPADAVLGELGESVAVRRGEHRRDWSTPRLGGLKVRVSAEDGARPLPGQQVRIQERFGQERQGVTDAEGSAHFRNLPVGSYRVLLLENGVRTAEKRQAVVAKATPTVEINPGSDVD